MDNNKYTSKTMEMLNEKKEKLVTNKFTTFQEDLKKEMDSNQDQAKFDKERYNDEESKKKKVNPLFKLFDNLKPIKSSEYAINKEPRIGKFDGLTTQDIIAPIDIEVDFNTLQMGDYFSRTFFISGYPRFVGPNWLSPIINFEHSLRISTFYYPVDSKTILEKLKRKIGEMEATVYGQMEERKVVDPSLKVALSDAQHYKIQ